MDKNKQRIKMTKNNVKIVNLTSHSLNLIPTNEVIPTGDKAAKVTILPRVVEVVNGIPIYDIEYSSISGLPEKKDNTIYVVSAPVLDYVNQHHKDRTDIVAPYKQLKDSNGITIACGGFRRNG